jgi:GntR family frlABCD operon transcriptional regulator
MLVAESSLSLYEQLKLLIKNDIRNNIYKPGQRMPSETELGDLYGVSRITVRRAIKELVNEGLLVCRQGKGTFVEHSKIRSQILDLGGFTETALKPGSRTTRILSKTMLEATEQIARYLQIPVGEEVLQVKRLLLEEDSPICIDTAYFPRDIFRDIIYKISDNISTFKLMREEYGIVMKKAYKEFSVAISDIEQSKLLECPPGEPLFSIDKVIYNELGRAVHLSNFVALSSRITYAITIEDNSCNIKIR